MILHAKELGSRADDQIVKRKSLVDSIDGSIGQDLNKKFVPLHSISQKGALNSSIKVELLAFKHTPESYINEILTTIRSEGFHKQDRSLSAILENCLNKHPLKAF